jgi:hypothetical protein
MLIRAIGWTSLVLGIASFIVFCATLFARKSPPKGAHVKGEAEGLARLAEAMAKVIEAFAAAGPTISALVASLVFVGFSVWVALHGCETTERSKVPTVEKSVPVLSDRCVIAGLPEPQTHGDSQSYGAGLIDLSGRDVIQMPKDCLDSVIAQAREDQPILMLLAGRADKRQLRSKGRRIYVDNFTLAYQRAASVKAYLLKHYQDESAQSKIRLTPEEFASRIVVLAAGPNHIEAKTSASELSDDRSVEVFTYWKTRPNL